MEFESLVGPLRSDVVSGAAVIARRAADIVERVAGDPRFGSGDELHAELVGLFRQMMDAQPSMAPLVALATRVSAAVRDGAGTEGPGVRAMAAARAFRAALDHGAEGVAHAFSETLTPPVTLITISASSTVSAAVEHLGATGDVRVVCLEGRPGMEGRRLATRLHRAGVRATLAVDAAAHALARHADAAVLGADSIGDGGFVNKIGSRALCHAASEAGIPRYVLADSTKLLPPGFPQPTDDDRPGAEVAPGGEAPGVEIWNRYFEVVPLDRITAWVSEEGRRSPAEADRVRSRLTMPRGLLPDGPG